MSRPDARRATDSPHGEHDTPDTHRPELVGSTQCPKCGADATTWWEIPLDAELNDEVYRVSCPECRYSETW